MSSIVSSRVSLHDYAPAVDTFREEVVAGLQRIPKAIPSKFFYDERGSALFDRITELDEYYPTRTELAIMERSVDDMVRRMGARCLLVEYGSGSSLKTRILLDHLVDPAGYVPIDISREHLLRSAQTLAEAYPDLRVMPVSADYTQAFDLPGVVGRVGRVVVYFPGSTIGNFTPERAVAFLRRMAAVAGPGGGLLIGVDLRKDPAVLHAAYNDAEGVTAVFNKNVLTRINRELGADFDVDAFDHVAFFNAVESRIEMHLESRHDQVVHLGGMAVPFRRGERIHTENSYKYTLEAFARLAHAAAFTVDRVWTDPHCLFSVQYLSVAGDPKGNGQ